MTDETPQTSGTSETFSVPFQWTPDLIDTQQNYLNIAEINTVEDRVDLNHAVIFILILSLCLVAYLLEHYGMIERMAGFVALVTGIVVWLASVAYERGLFKRANEVVLSADERFRSRLLAMPPSEITFGPEGYRDTSLRGTVTFPWRTFTEIREFQHGIVLMLSEQEGVFILDQTLPDGIDRAEAMRRFRKWKGPW